MLEMLDTDVRINNRGMNGQRSNEEIPEENEIGRLLRVEPIPVTYDSVPIFIHDNEHPGIHDEPARFYSRFRMTLYCGIIGLASIVLIFVFASLSVRSVSDGIVFGVKNVEILDVSDEGLELNITGISINFGKKGFLNWVDRLNDTEIRFVDDIKVYDDKGDHICDIDFENKSFDFVLDNKLWVFDIPRCVVGIEGAELSDFLKTNSGTGRKVMLKFDALVNGIRIPVSKSIRMENSVVLDKIVARLKRDVEIVNLSIKEYNTDSGFIGDGILQCRSNLCDVIPNLNFSVGVGMATEFCNLCDITIVESKKSKQIVFNVHNIDEAIIKRGVIDDILWRILNDDSHIEKFTFTVVGNDDHKRIPQLWLHQFWKNLELEMSVHVHELITRIHALEVEEETYPTIYVENIETNVDDSTGSLQFGAILSTEIKTLIEEFEISIDGDLLLKGMNLSITDASISKLEDAMRVGVNKVDVNISDVGKSKELVDSVLSNHSDIVVEPVEMKLRSFIKSSFFEGPLMIDGFTEVPLAGIATLIRSVIDGVNENNDRVIDIVDIEVIEGGSEFLKLKSNVNLKLPGKIANATNDICYVNMGLNYNSNELFGIGMFGAESSAGYIPLEFELSMDSSDRDKKRKIEEFVGSFISGVSVAFALHGVEDAGRRSLTGCNDNTCEFFDAIRIPLNVSSASIRGGEGRDSYFIKDTTMHVMSKEVEMTLYNPISNSDIIVEIESGEAICEGYVIGYLKEAVRWRISPGVWNSPRVKIEYANTGSAGWKIIQKTLKGDGVLKNMTVRAVMQVYVGGVPEWKGLDLMYQSSGETNGKIRW